MTHQDSGNVSLTCYIRAIIVHRKSFKTLPVIYNYHVLKGAKLLLETIQV